MKTSFKPNRRHVLAGLGAFGATPVLGQSLPSDPDVIIVGAGAAGLQAGRTLQNAGISFVILEGAGRVGGRAFTESASLGAPVDHGCSWINGATGNPFTKLGFEQDFTMVDHSNAGEDLFDLEGNKASGGEWTAYGKAWDEITSALSRAGRAGQDVPASSVIPENLPYSASVQTWMVTDYGVDLDQISTKSWWNSADGQPSYMVREGLGTLVATLAEGLPVSLNTKVTHIDHSGAGVRVETSQGTLRAKACLVTVSTGVLSAGTIKFTPALPAWKQDAIAHVPMGLLMKVPLMFDGARLGLGENNWVQYRLPEDKAGEGCFFVAWPCGLNYLMGFMGGRFAWDLYAQGQDAVVNYALDQVVHMVGEDARKHFVGGFATDWADNPMTMGSYGAVTPGHYGVRTELARPLDNKVFFAGEATAGAIAALVNGAYVSGEVTARDIIKALA